MESNLTGKKVLHSTLGEGIVISDENDRLSVEFASRISRFVKSDILKRGLLKLLAEIEYDVSNPQTQVPDENVGTNTNLSDQQESHLINKEPVVHNHEICSKANAILKELYGADARFRPGQYEAIEAVFTHNRSLVVQHTGWGKSLIYFISTVLNRAEGKGVTLVVSPLLALMNNQIEAAEKLGLRCSALNSTTKDVRLEIIQKMKANELDLVLVTPETLFSEDIQSNLSDISIGLFVVDEAHCISDWGHDFRLDYNRLKEIVEMFPYNVRVLATTATANNRVVEDLKIQLGNEVYVSRGPLMRKNMAIQILKLSDKPNRLAWMADHIPSLSGSGIVYCLTKRDCDDVSSFLRSFGISAESYYSNSEKDGEAANIETLSRFMNNEIKVIVATIKLGMGFDKGDVGFVIHYQMPSSVVAYYQQIGRAGRNIEKCYVFLMTGKEDEDIFEYFLKVAFPPEYEMRKVHEAVISSPGIARPALESRFNISDGRMRQVLGFLENNKFVYSEKKYKYFGTAVPFFYDAVHYEKVRAQRRMEMGQMKELVDTAQCYNRFIVNKLDDPTRDNCGCCSNCIGRAIIEEKVKQTSYNKARDYIYNRVLKIIPRKQWPLGAREEINRGQRILFQNQEGICLSKYGDDGYGKLVARDKYRNNIFCDELVDKSAALLKDVIEMWDISYITCIPSLRSKIVPDFTQRLADKLGITYISILQKAPASQQKDMDNSIFQCLNAFRSFSVVENVMIPQKVILVDDIVDSKWTMTVCGNLLGEKGCSFVFPFALADSSKGE